MAQPLMLAHATQWYTNVRSFESRLSLSFSRPMTLRGGITSSTTEDGITDAALPKPSSPPLEACSACKDRAAISIVWCCSSLLIVSIVALAVVDDVVLDPPTLSDASSVRSRICNCGVLLYCCCCCIVESGVTRLRLMAMFCGPLVVLSTRARLRLRLASIVSRSIASFSSLDSDDSISDSSLDSNSSASARFRFSCRRSTE